MLFVLALTVVQFRYLEKRFITAQKIEKAKINEDWFSNLKQVKMPSAGFDLMLGTYFERSDPSMDYLNYFLEDWKKIDFEDEEKILMLDNYDKGSYELDNILIKDLNETKAANYRNKFLGFVFQSFNLINYKSAVDNVILPLYYQGIKRKEREKTALDYLDNVGLKNWASHLPSELSGGQKQRVAIARAMVSKPKVLLADEPTGALDSNTSSDVMSLIQKINNSGKTILVVTHEEDIAKMCKRIVRLKDGVIVEDKKIKQKVL